MEDVVAAELEKRGYLSIVDIYTDGSCLRNPGGAGGYAVVLLDEASQKTKHFWGSDPETTNNQMELKAAILGLSKLKRPCCVTIYSDSKYIVRGMSEWMPSWIRNRWRTREGKPLKNRELWEELYQLSRGHIVHWEWVRGHDGHRFNEYCDRLAQWAAIQEHKKKYRKKGDADEKSTQAAGPSLGP